MPSRNHFVPPDKEFNYYPTHHFNIHFDRSQREAEVIQLLKAALVQTNTLTALVQTGTLTALIQKPEII